MQNGTRSKLKLFFIVLFFSCLLGGATAAIMALLLPKHDATERVAAIVCSALYAFFLLPDLVLCIEYFASRANRVSPQNSFWIGYFFGDLIAILLFLLAPVSGMIWYLNTAVSLIKNRKRRDDFENF